jgi:YD repeat-containing protein
VSEGTQNLQQQTQDQYLQEAQNYFAQSMGRIKGQMQSDSAQLESVMQQLPEESWATIQEMTDSYTQFEGTIDQAAQDAGVQDALEEAAQQARQSADETSGQGPVPVEEAADQVQEVAGGAAEQVQETAGEVADQAEETADEVSQMAENLPEGFQAVGETTTDEEGNLLQAARDPEGNLTEFTFDPQGNLIADQAEETVDEVGEEVSQMAENLPEGYEALGETTTDEEGNLHQRGRDSEGNITEFIFDPEGNLVDEAVVDEAAQMAENLPEGFQAVGDPTTDEEGHGFHIRSAGQPDGRGPSGTPRPSWVLDHDPALRERGKHRRFIVDGQRYDDGRAAKRQRGSSGRRPSQPGPPPAHGEANDHRGVRRL